MQASLSSPKLALSVVVVRLVSNSDLSLLAIVEGFKGRRKKFEAKNEEAQFFFGSPVQSGISEWGMAQARIRTLAARVEVRTFFVLLEHLGASRN